MAMLQTYVAVTRWVHTVVRVTLSLDNVLARARWVVEDVTDVHPATGALL